MGALGRAIQTYLTSLTGRRTVPNVFISGKSIGGGDEVASLARRNLLPQLLARARPEPSHETAVAEATDGWDAGDFVERALGAFPVVVFSKSGCPFCVSAKRNLQQASGRLPPFVGGAKVFELDMMGGRGSEVQRYLAEKTGRGTVPNVFMNGISVGGGDEIGDLAVSGALDGVILGALEAHDRAIEQNVEKGEKVEKEEKNETEVMEQKDISVEEETEKLISENAVTIFSKTYCGFCKKAVRTISAETSKTSAYPSAKVIELDVHDRGNEIQEYLRQKTGQMTVPNIFIGSAHVGGCDEVMALKSVGKLGEQIDEAYVKELGLSRIGLAGGCFWGVELALQRVVGVIRTETGYSNGAGEDVTYDDLIAGRSDAAEIVYVMYDETIVSDAELLNVWEGSHDVTSTNRQGNDVGSQYRSGIFYTCESQKKAAEAWLCEANERLESCVVSIIEPLTRYNKAEDEHQSYLQRRGQSAEKGDKTAIRCYG